MPEHHSTHAYAVTTAARLNTGQQIRRHAIDPDSLAIVTRRQGKLTRVAAARRLYVLIQVTAQPASTTSSSAIQPAITPT